MRKGANGKDIESKPSEKVVTLFSEIYYPPFKKEKHGENNWKVYDCSKKVRNKYEVKD